MDAAGPVYFLTGNKPAGGALAQAVRASGEIAELPAWLMDECYERWAISRRPSLTCCARDARERRSLSTWVEQRLLPLAGATDEERVAGLPMHGASSTERRGSLEQLITGEFRIGVSARSVVRALAAVSGIDANVIAHRSRRLAAHSGELSRARLR